MYIKKKTFQVQDRPMDFKIRVWKFHWGAGGMAQAVKCLPSKYRPWVQLPGLPKKKKKEKKISLVHWPLRNMSGLL
jgi:hypothetical protein